MQHGHESGNECCQYRLGRQLAMQPNTGKQKNQIMCAYSQVRDDDQYLVTIDGVIATSPNGGMDIDLAARDYASACGFLRLA